MLRISCLALLVMCLIGSLASAADDIGRSSLQGLRGVGVVVEAVDPEAERDGLTHATLQTDVELRLRQFGIRVFSKEEALATGHPFVYVAANLLRTSSLGNPYTYSIRLQVNQFVVLKRDPNITVFAATWWAPETVGITAPTRLSAVREVLQRQTDAFINAYLAMNPK